MKLRNNLKPLVVRNTCLKRKKELEKADNNKKKMKKKIGGEKGKPNK